MTQKTSFIAQEKSLENPQREADRWITVNGKRFHYIWLRDNCLCPKCHHPTSFQKIHDVSKLPHRPEPLSIVEEDDQLIITWKEKDPCHQSVFSISWLMDYAYDKGAGCDNLHEKLELRKAQEIRWDRAWIEANVPPQYEETHNNFDAWIEQIFTLGFAILKIENVRELQSLISQIGPIHKMEEGVEVYAVKSQPDATDLSKTGHRLDPHTDYESYMHGPHLLQFIYCVENETTGGESLLVDGFKVAHDFRLAHLDYFNLLAETAPQFQQIYTDSQYYYRRSCPIIEVNSQEQVTGVYVGPSHAYNWNLPFDKMESYYEAYLAFFSFANSPDYQYSFRLEPGDCIVMQNFRILHGRKAFDPTSGARELNVSYLPWSYFIGRENFKLFKDLYLQER
ncbi:MAG: TauD/TfdA family dioxygenase [Cyanobacteria bacterium P01_B01_bin.77]